MIRVLVVDDSLATRSAVSRGLEGEVDLKVLRPAPNGRVALQRLDIDEPDVVILDVDMPGLDGLEVLDVLRIRRPTLPVIMFSGLTERGAEVTLDALARGATDVLAKPTRPDEVEPTIRALAHKVRELGAKEREVALAGRSGEERHRSVVASMRPDVVVIGASTGGPNALTDLIPRFTSDFPVPILIVLHMPRLFTRQFAERLDRRSALRVCEATDGEAILPGGVWVAPGGRHMELCRRERALSVRLSDGPPENSCRPAVDVLFRSAAECMGAKTLGVVLTGMGQDGLAGAERIVSSGGAVVVQDEASSVVWGMPGSVARSGLASKVMPLTIVAGEIDRRVRANSAARTREVVR